MARSRPLSPHLQVYRLPLPALMSISHRATGVLLAAGSLVLVYWLADPIMSASIIRSKSIDA